MPKAAAKTAVLDLTKGVDQETYARTLNALRDGMNQFRISQGWCASFWGYIQSTVSPVFRYDSFEERVTVITDTFTSDASRAEELRLIRGRVLAYVGDRITLAGANTLLREAGLAEYTPDGQAGTQWRVEFPTVTITINAQENPEEGIQGKFRDLLREAGDTNPGYHANRVYVREAADTYHVPETDTVPLLNQ